MKNFLMKAEYVGNKGFLEKIALGDIFEHLSVYEDKFDKDCTEFDFVQAEQFVEDYTAKTKTSKKLVKEALSKYCVWYKEQKMYSGGIEVDIEGKCTEIKPNKTGEENIEANLEIIEEQESKINKDLKKAKKTEFNPDRYISEEELNKYCERLESPFDRLLLRSIYEGFDFSEEAGDIANIRLENCDLNSNIITFPSGKQMKISDELTKLLNECGKKGTDNYCFDNLKNVNSKLDEHQKILNAARSRIQYLKKELEISKLTISNLYYSGYLTALQRTGLESNYDLLSRMKTVERRELLVRYKLEKINYSNYQRKMKVYLLKGN